MKINEGEVPQYYVTSNHEPIIDPVTWDTVQAELARRAGKGTSNTHPFANTITCSDCGGRFGRKVWHSTSKYRRYIWRCNNKYNKDHHCATPHVTEDQIKDAFVAAPAKRVTGNDVLDDTMRLLDETVYDTRELETKQATLGERIEETITLMNQLITPQPRPPTTLTTTTAVTTSLKIGTTNLRPSINGSATRSTICATAEHKQSKYATTLSPNHHSNTPTKPGTPSSITPPSTTTALSNSHSRTALPRLEPALNE